MKPSIQELDALIRKDFPTFLQKVFAELCGHDTFHHAPYVDAMVHQLMRCYLGEERRLAINVPPRHLKSITVSVAFVAWVLGLRPSTKFICASYSKELSETFSVMTRRVMMSDWYLRAFPGTRIDPKSAAKECFHTTKGGQRLATSVGGAMTGMGCDYLIIDDAHKADEANSDAARENVLSWFRQTAITRLNNPSTGVIIVIGQRIHQVDLPGWLVEEGGYAHLNLPAIADCDEVIPVGVGRFWHRNTGDLLNPARMDREALEERRRSMGSIPFSAQYQQQPTPPDGEIVKLEWFKRYRILPSHGIIVQSWDPATSVQDGRDYSVGITALYVPGRFYIVDVLRGRWEFPQLRRVITQQSEKWRADIVIVEAVGAGLGLCQHLRQDGIVNVTRNSPKLSKEDRLTIASPMIESGDVWLPRDAPWLAGFLSEIAKFPNGKHDDQVDALSQLIFWRLLHRSYDRYVDPDSDSARGNGTASSRVTLCGGGAEIIHDRAGLFSNGW